MELLQTRFRGLLARWVGGLKVDSWEGTAAEMVAELEAIAKHGEFVFKDVGAKACQHEAHLRSIGWNVWLRRTKAARLICFERRKVT
jgi:hypothetical protein